jgi:Cys-tRNA(Pro)/Cys-tRNA(Cys) deacylase
VAKATRATQFLEKAGAAFTVHAYEYDPAADGIGLQAAAALVESAEKVLKTLMLLIDGKPACAVLPSDQKASLKRVAAALGGKQAEMMEPSAAERISGYKIGGISLFGQTRPLRAVIDESALRHDLVYINGGQRGLQVRLSPHDAVKVLGATTAAILAE